MCSSAQHADIPMPTWDDWSRAMQKEKIFKRFDNAAEGEREEDDGGCAEVEAGVQELGGVRDGGGRGGDTGKSKAVVNVQSQ